MSSDFFEPVDPKIEQRVRDSFERQGLMAHLGAVLHQVRRGLVVIRMPFRQELTQQHGYFHAGGLSAVADSAGGYAGLTMHLTAAGKPAEYLTLAGMTPADLSNGHLAVQYGAATTGLPYMEISRV